MKVCFISYEYPPNILGGAGTYAETIIKGLKNIGVDVFVITKGNRNNHDNKIYRVPTSNVQYWRRFFFMKPAMRLFSNLNNLFQFDIVHFNEPHILLSKIHIPTICTIHSTQINEGKMKLAYLQTLRTATDYKDLILKDPVGGLFDIFTAHTTDKIISPSPHLAKMIKSYCFINEKKICVVLNGIDLEAFDKTEDYDAGVLRKYDLDRDNYLLFIGRLSPMKGVQYLIPAFKDIKKRYTNLKLVIAGSGEKDYEVYLRNLAHGIKDIVFTGYIDSLRIKKILYENCLAVVVPSLYEGLPMVILEAMACRKAIVASEVGGIPLLIQHGKNGFLVDPGDSKSLKKSIRILLEDENLRKNMGDFGRKLVEKEFTIDKMAKETLKVYKSIC